MSLAPIQYKEKKNRKKENNQWWVSLLSSKATFFGFCFLFLFGGPFFLDSLLCKELSVVDRHLVPTLMGGRIGRGCGAQTCDYFLMIFCRLLQSWYSKTEFLKIWNLKKLGVPWPGINVRSRGKEWGVDVPPNNRHGPVCSFWAKAGPPEPCT